MFLVCDVSIYYQSMPINYQNILNSLLFMTSQIDTHSFHDSNQLVNTKKDKMAIKRLLRKQKFNTQIECEKHKPIGKMTKQQKIRFQKQRNRQAAQRSRDLHREYVTGLQKQIEELKQKLIENKRLCCRCRKSLSINQQYDFEPEMNDDYEESALMLFRNTNEKEDQQMQEPLNCGQEYKSEPDSFMRIYDPEESNNFIKMVLFVVVICIGVMAINSRTVNNISNGRQLQEIYNKPIEISQFIPKARNQRNYMAKDPSNPHGLIQLHKNIENKVCIDSLMNVDENMKLKRSLTAIHHDNYPSSPGQGIFICSFQSPTNAKIYSVKPQMTQVPLVKLFVLGSQIKDMLNSSSHPGYSSMIDKNIQLNGIYKLNAQLKSIELVSHHNCLL